MLSQPEDREDLRVWGLDIDILASFVAKGVRVASPNHGDPARADKFVDAIRPHAFDERLDFIFSTRDFDHHLFGPDVYDSGAEDFGKLADFTPFGTGWSRDFDEHQIALDIVVGADVLD
jgi:hypothetical protein